MSRSSCGRRTCPGICVRVCHCPAGLARSHQLLTALRNRRELFRSRPLNGRPCPPNVNLNTGEILDIDHHFNALVKPTRRRPFRYQPTGREPRQSGYGSRNIQWLTSATILTGFLVLVAILLTYGFIVNGTSITGHYQVPNVNTYDPWWYEK